MALRSTEELRAGSEVTPERARYVLANGVGPLRSELRFAFYKAGWNRTTYDGGITSKEDFYIMTLWQSMSDDTCYHDVLVRIARGNEDSSKEE
jgi:hypothetical protein